MGQVSRARPHHDLSAAPSPGGTGYDSGGHIALLQAEIAQRLASPPSDRDHASAAASGQRLLRLVSVGAGYGALLGGYAAAAAAIYLLI